MRKHNHEALAQKRLDALFNAVEEDRTDLELFVEAEHKTTRRLAKELSRLGEIGHVFDGIPYISIRCKQGDAKRLVNWMYRNEVDYNFQKAFGDSLQLIQSLQLSNTVSIIPDKVVKNYYPRKQEEFWNLEAVGAYEARKYGDGNGATVAIIDTGVDYTHNELSKNFGGGKGYDFVLDNDDPIDYNGHGTHVAGITSGETTGIAINSRIYALRVLDENGSGTEADVMAGIEWAAKHGCDVANMSLGAPVSSQAFEEMCAYAASQGLLLVAAAGNDGANIPVYPAAFDSVIAVAAINEDYEHADFSNYYSTNDLSAPGVNIVSAFPNNRYRMFDGTSMATPHVTGSIALAMSISRNKNLEQLLEETTEELGGSITDDERHELYGYGLVRIDKAAKQLCDNYAKALKIMRKVKEVVW